MAKPAWAGWIVPGFPSTVTVIGAAALGWSSVVTFETAASRESPPISTPATVDLRGTTSPDIR